MLETLKSILFVNFTAEMRTSVKIALCDDNDFELQKAKTIIDNFISEKMPEQIITLNTYDSAVNLLFEMDRIGGFDLLILDIIMPGLSGIELATEIRAKNNNCKIIFLTSSPEFAVASYKVDAFYYLLKPISEAELKQQLEKAFSQMENEKSASIIIKETKCLTRVKIHTIQYVESIKHTINFHLSNGEIHSCYGTINEFSEILLSDSRFSKCHKSFIINMDYVKSISSNDFVMSDSTLIPISRKACQQIKNDYINYFFNKGI